MGSGNYKSALDYLFYILSTSEQFIFLRSSTFNRKEDRSLVVGGSDISQNEEQVLLCCMNHHEGIEPYKFSLSA